MKALALVALMLACLAFHSPASAARVTVTGGSPPNPPICTSPSCIYLNEVEFAQNGVGVTLRNDAALKRIVEQAQARTMTAIGLPLEKRASDKQWFYDWVKVKDVTQEVQLEAPTIVGSSALPVLKIPTSYRNCGSQESSITLVNTVRTKEEITKEIEEQTTSVITSDLTLTASANYKAISASVTSKITSQLTNFRRTLTRRYVENEFTSQATDPIKMPPNSIVDRGVVQRSRIDTYQAKGIVTTDATLYLPIHGNISIGKWSDFAPVKDRQIDIEPTTKVLVRETEYIRNTLVFPSESECRATQ
jgi:hypothetical protein